MLRFNLGYDRELPWWDLVASVEAVYADSIKEIKYENVNIRQNGTLTQLDGRPFFETVNPGVTGAYLITNTSEGDSTNIAFKLEKPYRGGIWGSLAYVWGDSNVVIDGTSSRAVSNWQFNEALNPNDPPLSTSDFEVEHRITATLSYRFNDRSKFPTTVSMFYNHQSGRPYTYLLGTSRGFRARPGSLNGDGFFFSNDLFYVPSGPDDVIIQNGTWEDLDAFIKSQPCLDSSRGSVAKRNCADGPWSSSLDLRVAQEIPVGFGNLQVTLDLLNLANLLDRDNGLVRYVNFGTFTVASYNETADGQVVYELGNLDQDLFAIDNERSRWRAKLGVRWTF